MNTTSAQSFIFHTVETIDVDEVLAAYFKENEKVNLVIIGANNGKTTDFLLNYLPWESVTAILVEPVAELFLQLKENLGTSGNMYFENAAVYERNCRKTIY